MLPKPKPLLLQQISQGKFLKQAWKLLNTSNEKSSGLSRSTMKDYENNLNRNLKILSNSLSTGKFTFSPVKGVALEKKNKGHRPLMISEIQDRVVHKALALKLEARLSRIYKLKNQCSFAYQKGLSIQDAIIQMVYYYSLGYKFILEADIQSFFPSVNNEHLLDDIYKKLSPDISINELLKGSLNQQLGNIEELKQKNIEIYNDIFASIESGIPQGNALSPLLANVYLSSFDHQMINKKIKMIRYADDFIIMCKSKDEAKAAYNIAIEELETKLHLKLYPLKEVSLNNEKISRILNPKEHQFSFLSIKFDGEKCTVIDKKIISLLSKLTDFSSREKLKIYYPNQELGLLQVLTKFRNAIEGWVAAYSFLEIESQLLEIDKHINIILYNIFKEFDFSLQSPAKITTQKSLKVDENRNTILKWNSNKKNGLNPSQRKSTGIPLCINLYKKATDGMMSFKEIIDAKSKGLDVSRKRPLKIRTTKKQYASKDRTS